MKLPAIQFYPGDWLRDNVAGCSLAAQGLWLRMMFVAHDCDSYGKLSVSGRALLPAEIARRCGCSLEEFSLLFKELESAGVPSRDDNGAILSRRMVRDAEVREMTRKRVARHRCNGDGNASVTQSVTRKYEDEDEDEDEEPEDRRSEELPESLRSPEFAAAWSAWELHRRQIRKKLTPLTCKKQLKMLADLGLAQAVKSIEQSIQNGWAGLFEPKPDPAEKGKIDWDAEALRVARAAKGK